jgi:hypothetical protein
VFGRKRRDGGGGASGGGPAPGDVARDQLGRIPVTGDARAVERELTAVLADDPGLDLPRLAWVLGGIADAVTSGDAWADPARYRGLVDGTFWAEAEQEAARQRASGWRTEVGERAQPAVSVHELENGNLTVEVRSTYARRVFDAHGTQIEGDHAPRPHTTRVGAMRFVEARTPPDGGVVAGRCPSCGTPLLVTAERTCHRCAVELPDPYRDWVVMWCYAID